MAKEITIPRADWHLRDYQKGLWEASAVQGRNVCACMHRRAGKDEVLLNATLVQALKSPASYAYMLPENAHARRAMWQAVNPHTGKRRILETFIPEVLASDPNETEMRLNLVNGSVVTFFGSDNYDRLVGASLKGIVSSEHALSHPSAYAFFSPMLRENNGFFWAISTPRGRNHFHSLMQYAEKSSNWYAEYMPVTKTGALTPDQLEEAKAEYVALYGLDQGEALFSQEYLCDWNAAILGAFYAREIALLRAEGRVCDIEAVPGIPVHRAWDIGVRDDTSIWWFQVVGTQVFILDCYSSNGAGVDHYAEIIDQKREENGWEDGIDWVPHDAKVKEWGTGRTRVETMMQYGLHPQVVPQAGLLDGINAARRTLSRCVFSTKTEDLGLNALEQYRREWDEDKKTFKANPCHDWSSHLSDSFRYLSLAWQLTKSAAPKIIYPDAPSPYHLQITPPIQTRGGRSGF